MRRAVVTMAAAVALVLISGTGANAAVSHPGAGSAAIATGAAQGGRTDSAPARAPGSHRAHRRQDPAKQTRRPQRQTSRRTRSHQGKHLATRCSGPAAGRRVCGRVGDAAHTGSQGLAVDRARGRAPPTVRARRSSANTASARHELSLSSAGRATPLPRARVHSADPVIRIAATSLPYDCQTFGEPDCGETCAYAGDPDAATGSPAGRTERLPDRFRTGRPVGAAV